MDFRSLASGLTQKGRITLIASVAGIVIVSFLLFRLASQPSLTVIATGVDPAQTGKITAALDERAIGYEIQSGGTAVAVEKAKVSDARIALASSGVSTTSGGSEPGFELLEKTKLGASEFQQQVSYQRALEGEISRMIGQVEGVSSAQVQLVLPEDRLFADEQAPATASVLLTADMLEPGAIRGIAQLVASGVKGLKASNVSITDQTGQLLWPTGDGSTGGGGGGDKATMDARYSRQLEASLGAMLLQTLGPGKARVQVSADLDADQTTQDELSYAKTGTPLKTRKETEQLEGGAAGGGGAGTTGNVPTYAQGTGGGASNYERETEETDYGVNKVVTRRKVAAGKVNRLQVALIVDKSVPADQAAAVKTAVAAAAGVQADRGDVISMSQVAFAKPPELKEAGGGPLAAAGPAVGYAKYVALAIGLALFLFFVTRHLRKREAEALADPTWLREISAPRALSELESPAPMRRSEAMAARKQVEELVAREPERVAQQVRTWMHED